MVELNPQHPTTAAIHDHWHKIACILMFAHGHKEFVITKTLVDEMMGRPGGINIVVKEDQRGLVLRIVDNEEAALLLKNEGETQGK